MENINEIKAQTKQAITELIDNSNLQVNDIVVLGGSSSEIIGKHIGKSTSLEVSQVVVSEILKQINENKLYLAVQGCEHINRTLVIEKELALKLNLETVSVRPVVTAGGGVATAAYELFKEPVMVETIQASAGIDIGDTSIGMHVKRVQIPLRLSIKKIGYAHVTYLKRRDKLIGGPRAEYL